MKKQVTNSREIQRSDFAKSLYTSLRKQAETLLEEQEEILSKTAEYLEDGLSEEECSELLIIEEGICREASICFIEKVKSGFGKGLNEYSYSFEDTAGRVWSSFDIEKNVFASSEEEAWTKVSETLDEADLFIDFDHIVSVDILDSN